jgi:Tfp pilus assembly protein PilW
MECRITFSRTLSRTSSGSTLPEAIIAIGVTAMLVVALCSFTVFTGHNFAALFNYVDLDDMNKTAMDQITRDVRQANQVTAYATNRLTLQDSDGSPIVYTYSSLNKTLARTATVGGVANTKTILTECDKLKFEMAQRNTRYGGYDVVPSTNAALCKVVNVSWLCSRKLLGIKENTESVQTARIVIRKQGS